MAKESALCQLMKVRMNGVMNGITNSDGEYQEIIRKSDVYSDKLERMELPEEVRLLIDRYVSEQNAHSTCAIDQGMGCSPTCHLHVLLQPVYKPYFILISAKAVLASLTCPFSICCSDSSISLYTEKRRMAHIRNL